MLIGNGGAEYGVRGYVSAYDADTGKLAWRFYTVPGDPSKGPDGAASDPMMAKAAETDRSMASFARWLSPEQAEAVRGYVGEHARTLKAQQAAAPAVPTG